ncbi:MAG: hypothetical protein BZY81_00745 [SAR202 cluster bacterium Io17-Chloro-G4]|nr:MAG: hypothetical protein BZY81_00745 [SAR202 cluster bacterium Io17-Chloro-G4]
MIDSSKNNQFRLLSYVETAMIIEVIPKVGRVSILELDHPKRHGGQVGTIVTKEEIGSGNA